MIISATIKKIIAMNIKPNLIVAHNDAINGLNDHTNESSVSIKSKLMFSITSNIPAMKGIIVMNNPISCNFPSKLRVTSKIHPAIKRL